MIFKRSKHKIDQNAGVELEEATEIWVADFGHHSLSVEEELRQEVARLKPKIKANFSWTIASIVLVVFIVITELLLRQGALKVYWSEQDIFWLTWIWRLILIMTWLLIARLKYFLAKDRMFITAIVSFVSAVMILGVIKIIYVQSTWVWLNLLVEPIWVILMIAFLGVIVIKFTKNKKEE